MNRDFIPRSDGDAEDWGGKFIRYLNGIREKVGFPMDAYELLKALQEDFSAKYKIATTTATRTKLTIDDKDAAREAFVSATRGLVKSYLAFNPQITDTDRDGLGITVPKDTRTPAPIEEVPPSVSIDTSILRVVKIFFSPKGEKKKSAAKPPGQHGVEILYCVGAKPADAIDQMGRSVFSTHSPVKLVFTDAQRGQVLSFVIRWENTRGQKGEWSAIIHVIIP
jgi:hypothetical protein